MTDLTTTYLGMKLKNPLVASASPLSKKVELARRLEESGVSAIVMYSLFEEQILHDSKQLDHFLSFGTNSFQEAMSYFPEMEKYNVGPEGYLTQIDSLKKATTVPIIASLNGISSGGWVEYARRIQDAGADALELNFYYIPTQLELPSLQLEKAYIQLVKDIRAVISIPMAVKLSASFLFSPGTAAALFKSLKFRLFNK